jgi:formate dehydrogenase subunit delta
MSNPSSPDEKLVRMANQIAQNMMSHPHDQAVAGVAEHLQAFWTPKMRRQIIDHAAGGGAGLEALTREAVERLAEKAKSPES